jgi:hypothetical protein
LLSTSYFWVSKVGGWKPKKLPWPHFEFLSFVLGVLSMVEIKFFLSWPPTFNAKSRRPRTKRFAFSHA